MATTIFGAAVGVFGNGWLSVVEMAGDNGSTVLYARFARAHSPIDLSIAWSPQQSDAVLSIERAYLDHFAIEEVRPPPVAVTVDRERLRYSFRVGEGQTVAAIAFTLRAKHGGLFVGSVRFDDGTRIGIRQFVFP